MKFVSDFPHEVIEQADMGIVMSDGCRLSARVWMPTNAAQQPAPVILEHLPYRKRDGTIVRDQFTHPWFAGHGYVCIRTDMRGNGESEGLMTDEYTEQELQDAVEVIEWAAKQPWCNGNVGMMGISWGGFNGLQVAALAPEPLKAVISLCSTADRYADDIHYKGGCLLGENFGWSSNMLSYSSRPPDPALVGDQWRDMWLNRLENMPLSLSTWLRHQHRDSYWEHGSVCEDYSAIKAAVLSIGGWHDGYRNTISHLVENLISPVKGIVGPWIHKYPHYAGPAPAVGFLQEAKRWWDQYLKGDDTGVANDPGYRAYLMDSVKPERWLPERPGRWIAEQDWPSANINAMVLDMGNDRSLIERQENSATAPIALGACKFSSPQDCGVAAGEYFPFAFGDELPAEQTVDDARSLCFDGEPTEQTLDIVGAPTADLILSCDKPNGHITVRLLDLWPDGTSALITYGVLNLTHRNSHQSPEAIEVNQPFKISVMLDHIAYRLPSGHRLRLALSTANWPTLWPSPEGTTLTLSNGSVSIPCRQQLASADEYVFEEPEGAPAWHKEVLRKDDYSRETLTDGETGAVTTIVACDFGENRDLTHGLISGGRMKECWSIHSSDPLSAKVVANWEQTGGREGAMWRTVVETAMWSDKEYFYFDAQLVAFENDHEIFRHDYKDQVARQLV